MHSLPIDTTLDSQLQTFWNLETLWVERGPSLYDNFTNEINFENGWYKWCDVQEGSPQLPTRQSSAVQEQIAEPTAPTEAWPWSPSGIPLNYTRPTKEGIIELALAANEPTRVIHYLPHHLVVQRDKTMSKVSIV